MRGELLRLLRLAVGGNSFERSENLRRRLGIWRADRARSHGGRKAEFPQRVIRPVSLAHEHQHLGGLLQRLLELKIRRRLAARISLHGPAALCVVLRINGVLRRESLLLKRRRRLRELQLLLVVLHGEVVEDEIARVAATGTAGRQRSARQRVELDARRSSGQREREFIRVGCRVVRDFHFHRIVFAEHELARAIHSGWTQHGPRYIGRSIGVRRFPFGLRGVESGVWCDQFRPQLAERCGEFGQLCLLLFRCDCHAFLPATDDGLFDVCEERAHRIKIPRRHRVELMVVALRAHERLRQPSRADALHAVHDILRLVLLRLRAAFLRGENQSIVAARHSGIAAGIRQQIPSDLLHGEPVEGFVFVKGPDHVIAIRPHVPAIVGVIARRVRKAHEVQPPHRHPLAELLRGQQPLHELPIGIRRSVIGKSVHFSRLRRQAQKVERETACQRRAVCLRRGRKAQLRVASANERIHRSSRRPLPHVGLRHSGLRRWDVGPVRLILRALLDPLFEHGLLACRELPVRLAGRHHLILIRRKNALP